MKKFIYIVVLILTVALAFTIVDSFKGRRAISDLIKTHENEVKDLEVRNTILEEIINQKVNNIAILESKLDSINDSEELAKQTASKYKSDYYALLEESPETCEDKLDLAERREAKLLDVVKVQDVAIVKCDSAKVVLGDIVEDLNNIIAQKEAIALNDKKIISSQKIQIKKLTDLLKKEKRKALIKDIGVGGAVVAVVVVIILL